MIAQKRIQHIEHLLAEDKLSQREIARVFGISRGTVGVIASGRRPDYEELRRRRKQEESPRQTGPPKRCPGCGAMVVFPCLACELKKDGHGIGHLEDDGDSCLHVGLTDESMRRYKEAHDIRRVRGEPIPVGNGLENACSGKTLNSHRRHCLKRRSRHVCLY